MHSVHCQEWQNWYLGFAAFLFLLLVRLHSFYHLSQIFQLRNFVVLQLHQEEALIAAAPGPGTKNPTVLEIASMPMFKYLT